MARHEFQLPNVLRHEGSRPYWYIRYRRKMLGANGEIERKEVWHQLGDCSQTTKREAMRLREEVLRKLNREVYTIQNQTLFADFADLYLNQHTVTLAPGGRKRDESLIRNHLLPAFGTMRLCDIGTQQIQIFLNGKTVEGLSWWTRRALQAVMSSIYTKAEDWDYWDSKNPARRITLGRKRVKRERRILTDEQFRLLLDAIPGGIRLMVETAVSTGMRISEILGLKWRCVDLRAGLIKVEERFYRGDSGEPKSERGNRVLPLGTLAECYRHHRPANARPEMYVFEAGGKPLDDRTILREVIRPAAKDLGFHFEGFGWHTFRRQNLTLLQEEGATTFEAMAQAGHSRPAMTGEYTIVGFERREKAVRRLQQRLFSEQQPVVRE